MCKQLRMKKSQEQSSLTLLKFTEHVHGTSQQLCHTWFRDLADLCLCTRFGDGFISRVHRVFLHILYILYRNTFFFFRNVTFKSDLIVATFHLLCYNRHDDRSLSDFRFRL